MKNLARFVWIMAVLLLFAVGTTGCWDSKDINEKTIATCLILDKKDGKIWFVLEFANINAGMKSQNEGTSSASKYSFVKGEGTTIAKAREDANRKLPKQLYLSGERTVVMTEKFAESNLVEYLYRFRAKEDFRKKGLTVITREDPQKMLDLLHEESTSVGFAADELIDTLDATKKSFSRTSARLIENLSTTYTGILIPCIGLKDEEFALVGYSVVSGSKVIGFLPAENSQALVYLKADEPEFEYRVASQDFEFTFEVSLTKRKVTPYYENGRVSFRVAFEFEAELMYGDQKIPYHFDEAATADVKEKLTKTLNKELTAAVEQAQKEFKCDYLQFDDEFRVVFPMEFEKMDWQSEFPKATIALDVKVDVSTIFMMDYSIDELK